MSIAKQRALVVLATQLAACSAYDPGGDGRPEQGAEQSEDLVLHTWYSTTGAVTNVDRTSETAAVLAADLEPVVAFHRNDGAHTSFSGNDRAICRGGVNLGVAKRSTGWQLQVPSLPQGYAFLWGAPGLGGGKGTVVTPATSTLFLSMLAAPNDKFDLAVELQGSLAADGCFHGEMADRGSPLAGACIARSDDNGATFRIDPALDCVRYHFDVYDGGSIAVSRTSAYAAFLDESESAIHVYRTPLGIHAKWSAIGYPFPTRLCVGQPLIYADGTSAFVVAPTTYGFFIAAYSEATSSWSANKLVVVADPVASVHLGNGTEVHGRGGYDAAIGLSAAGEAQLKFVYSTVVNGKAELRSADCALHPSISCSAGSFASESGFNAFSPNVAFAQIPGSAGAPSTGVWHVSYQSDGGTNVAGAVKLRSMNFSGGSSIARTGQQVPCADGRGYWGDYDAMLGFNATSSTGKPSFLRFVTDSTASSSGSCQTTRYDANAQRVSFVRW